MVKDRHIVSIKVEQEDVCALSNGDIAADLECPLTRDVKTVYFSEPVTGLPKPVFYRLPKGE